MHQLILDFAGLGFPSPWRAGRFFAEAIIDRINPWRSG